MRKKVTGYLKLYARFPSRMYEEAYVKTIMFIYMKEKNL